MNTYITAPELAPEDAWFKSSYSGGANNNCVEIANLTATRAQVGVRDSKNPSGPALLFAPAAWTSFIGLVQTGQIDFGSI